MNKNKKVHFVDCGANVGHAIDWAINKYEKRLIQVDAFEPEYINYSALLASHHIHPPDFDNVMFHKKAVWIKNEIKAFHIQFWGTRTGSSLMIDKEHIIKTSQQIPDTYIGDSIPTDFSSVPIAQDQHGNRFARADITMKGGPGIYVLVQCIDLSEWIFNNLNRDNHNVLKIDIEGAEYEVIDHLLNTGAHEYIDEWLVEFTCKLKLPESYSEEVFARFESIIPNYVDWGKVKFSEERNKFRGTNAREG
tara:strand:- start:716 stop:1462 length:747 start_codon:yes stop_codon:yes gene_type:complete